VHQSDIAIARVSLQVAAMNVVYAASAYPFGKSSDRISHAKLLPLGLVILTVADLALTSGAHWPWFWQASCCGGYTYQPSVAGSMVATTAPADLRGAANITDDQLPWPRAALWAGR
jgi:MFS family permease